MMITFISADSLGLPSGPSCGPGIPGVGTTLPLSCYSFAGAGAAATHSFLLYVHHNCTKDQNIYVLKKKKVAAAALPEEQ